MCEFHVGSHILSYGEHLTKRLYFKDLDNRKQFIIDSLVRCKIILKENIKLIKSFTIQAIKIIESKSISLIKEMTSQYNDVKKNLKIFFCDSLINLEIFEKFNTDTTNTFNPMTKNSEVLEKGIEKIFKSIISKPYDDNFAIIFEQSIASHVKLIDLNTFASQSIDLQLKDMLNNCVCPE
jgi:hypothetical protein